MNFEISKNYIPQEEQILRIIKNFDLKGQTFGDQPRNTLKLFKVGNETLNVKSFKIPNIVNRIAYRYLRKGKARRSFEYAHKILSKGIQTPEPVAYAEESGLLFGRSYYVSKQLEGAFEYREMIFEPKFPNRYEILKQFTRFTFKMHENGIEFLDHSPGNTLIFYNEQTEEYEFYLVDLNRMKFHQTMSYPKRIKNFARLTPEKNMVYTMSAEYAKLINREFEEVFKDMWQAVQVFRKKHEGKKRLKRKLMK